MAAGDAKAERFCAVAAAASTLPAHTSAQFARQSLVCYMAYPLFAWFGCFLLLLGGGCSVTASEEAASRDWPDPTTADAAAYAALPQGFGALAASRLPTDASGLIGRNQTWGALYSPRFQLGAGAALRTTLAAGRASEAARAFRVVEAGTEVIGTDGSIPSALPPSVGGTPSPTDIASAAAFFLGDACLGLLALEASPAPDRVATPVRREAARASVARATGWLLAQRGLLTGADRSAPNRLLFDALAFQACGVFASEEVRTQADREATAFVDASLGLYDPSGFFVEGGGHDTSYQGVALRVGEDVLLAGYPDKDGRLQSALAGAAAWLADRIDDAGQIDSRPGTLGRATEARSYLGSPSGSRSRTYSRVLGTRPCGRARNPCSARRSGSRRGHSLTRGQILASHSSSAGPYNPPLQADNGLQRFCFVRAPASTLPIPPFSVDARCARASSVMPPRGSVAQPIRERSCASCFQSS